MSEASYTYAVARGFDPAPIAGVRGVDGARVELVHHADLVAVVSGLAPAAAEASALRARLEVLEELETLARAHHAVVEAVAAHSVTLPLRLATIHRGNGRVAEVLRQGYARFCACLERLAGHVELGVKVYLASSSDLGLGAVDAAPDGSASPGRAYLRHRRHQRQQQEEAWQRAASAASQIDTGLRELATDRRALRPQDQQLSGAASGNILNLAYLVDASHIDEFARQAQGLASAHGVSVAITGPWAPYSFSEVSEVGADVLDGRGEPS